MFLKISQIYGKIPVLMSLFNKVAGLKEAPTQVFSCEICEIFKNPFFSRTPAMAASEQTQEISVVHCVTKGLFWSFSTSLPWLSNTMLNLLTKNSSHISLLFKLKYAAILLLSYIVDCE